MDANTTAMPAPKKTSSGLDENVAGLLCYILGWVTGLIFLLIEKDNKFVRFHAWQSIALSVASVLFFIVITILGFLPVIGIVVSCLSIFVWLGYIILVIFLMVQAYQGKMYKLPVLGDFVEKNLMK